MISQETFEKRKKEITEYVELLEKEIEILSSRIVEFKKRLNEVKTVEDSIEFDKYYSENDLEKDLKVITLF